ncbi:MAG: PIN domain-containing protein [Candidatus Diapherotrites archaeon]
MQKFFADSYAIIDYLKGNKKLKKYFEESELITTKLNLMEVYYSALLESTEEMAEKYYDSFLDKCVEIEDNTIKAAMKLRFKEKAKKLSYVDAAGYQIALERNIKFLTGDEQFREMRNVEFIK